MKPAWALAGVAPAAALAACAERGGRDQFGPEISDGGMEVQLDADRTEEEMAGDPRDTDGAAEAGDPEVADGTDGELHPDDPFDLGEVATDAGADVGVGGSGPISLFRGRAHPWLVCDRGTLAELPLRIAEDDVVAALWQQAVDLCARGTATRPDPLVYDPYSEEFNATTAFHCALVGLVNEDDGALAKAGRLLLGMRGDVETTPFDVRLMDKPTIHGGPAVMMYALAWDLLMAEPERSFPEGLSDADRARDLLLAHADALRDFYAVRWRGLLSTFRNNHNIRHASGVLMAALAVPEDDDARSRLDFGAVELLGRAMDRQSLPGGGWAEGPGYFAYSAEALYPSLIALHRALNGGAVPVTDSCASAPAGTCTPHEIILQDPWLDPRIDELHRWEADMTMPDGSLAPFDDGKRNRFPWPFASLFGEPGAWLRMWRAGTAVPSVAASADLTGVLLGQPIALDSIEPLPAGPLMSVYEEGGQAVLRSSHADDASWVLLLGENGPARNGGHEHPDSTSFSWFVAGAYALIDSGYPGYTDRLATAPAEFHNLVLVDGVGPPVGSMGVLGVDVDAALFGCEELGDSAGTCAVAASWGGADLRRRIFRLGSRALLVVDRIAGAGGRELTHLLHGGSPPESATPEQEGATWHIGELRVEARVATTATIGARELLERPDASTTSHRHAVLATGVRATEETTILALMYARAPGDETRFEPLEGSGQVGWSWEDGATAGHVAWSGPAELDEGALAIEVPAHALPGVDSAISLRVPPRGWDPTALP